MDSNVFNNVGVKLRCDINLIESQPLINHRQFVKCKNTSVLWLTYTHKHDQLSDINKIDNIENYELIAVRCEITLV